MADSSTTRAEGPGLLCSLHHPDDWPTWLKAAGVLGIDGNSGLKFENSALAYQAATDELGIVMAQLAFVADDLKSGRLVAPLPIRATTGSAYSLAYPAAPRQVPESRPFRAGWHPKRTWRNGIPGKEARPAAEGRLEGLFQVRAGTRGRAFSW